MRVMNLGTYDLLHPGHVHLLRTCAELAGSGEVVVALNPDDFIARFKGHPPVMSYAERAAVLDAVVWVNRVVPNYGAEDAKPVIAETAPDLIVAGADWAAKDYFAQLNLTPEWLEAEGIRLVYAFHPHTVSSTALRARAREIGV